MRRARPIHFTVTYNSPHGTNLYFEYESVASRPRLFFSLRQLNSTPAHALRHCTSSMMNRLRSKSKHFATPNRIDLIELCPASNFFKDSPTQDEKAAITLTEQDVDFNAGIERGLKKKRKCVHTQRLGYSLQMQRRDSFEGRTIRRSRVCLASIRMKVCRRHWPRTMNGVSAHVQRPLLCPSQLRKRRTSRCRRVQHPAYQHLLSSK